MTLKHTIKRRELLGAATAGAVALILPGCEAPPPERYNQADIDLLAAQREDERQRKGQGRFAQHIYKGYRGLADLPWFSLDEQGELFLADESVPAAIDVHCHLGMSVLFKPSLDLLASTPRVRHLLDCDATQPGGDLDLDVYVNGNFSDAALSQLRKHTIAQALWGSRFAETQTIPNLLREMRKMRVQQALLLPIKLGFPFGDTLTEDWLVAVDAADAQAQLHVGMSVYPGAEGSVEQMRVHAARGARIIKLHPTVQRFYPDDPAVMPIYEEAQKLGLVVFFHGGRAGIEPESSHPYAMPRHYEAALANFPQLQFILGHAGARDGEAMLELALRYDNAWIGIHGQSLTHLEKIIRKTRGDRLLFGTDWPFYHIGASLAKVLITTEKRQDLRERILRGNAQRLFEIAPGNAKL